MAASDFCFPIPAHTLALGTGFTVEKYRTYIFSPMLSLECVLGQDFARSVKKQQSCKH